MKKVIIMILALWMGQIYAQQSFAASGRNAFGSGGSSSYTVGQIAYSSKGANNQITEGIQQPYEILTLTVSDNSIEKNISLYPNPVKDFLFVDFNQEKFANSSYQLFDAQGKLVKKGNFSQKKNELDFSMLLSSVYIIRIFSENEIVKTFKIIKK